jgi:hypothetical protein
LRKRERNKGIMGNRTIEYHLAHGGIINHLVVTGALCLSAYLYLRPVFQKKLAVKPNHTISAPLKLYDSPGVAHARPQSEVPYPPDVLPGGRDVLTPYGSIRVFEWGRISGEKVLLLHGIGTPCLALGSLAKELVGRGYRVMLFGEFLAISFFFAFFCVFFSPP